MESTGMQRLMATLKFVLPAGIVGFLVWTIEPAKWDELASQPKNYWLLLAALMVALTGLTVSFARWCVLVRAQGIALSVVEALRLGAIGYLLSFVSAGSVGGDLFKAIFLAKRRPGKRVAAIASVVVDRGTGLYGLLLLVTFGLLINPNLGQQPADQSQIATPPTSNVPHTAGPEPPALSSNDLVTDSGDLGEPDENAKSDQDAKSDPDDSGPQSKPGLSISDIKWITAGLVSSGTFVLVILVFGGRGVDRLIGWGSRLPVIGRIVEAIGPPIRSFHHQPLALAASILMSIFVQGTFVISMYLIACGLYSSQPLLLEHFVIVPVGMLTSALPLTPGGVGVLEATIGTMYKLVPAVPTPASGVLVALVFELVKLVMAIIGTLFYWAAKAEVQQSLQDAQDEPNQSDEPTQPKPSSD